MKYLPDKVIPNFLKKKERDIPSEIKKLETLLEKVKKGQTESADFDIFGQTNPGSTNQWVREKLIGKDLYYLRNYYMSDLAPIDKIIIERFIKQARALSNCVGNTKNRIGWRVVAENYDSPDFKPPKNYDEQCRWFESLVQSINKDRHPGGFKDGFIANLRNGLLYDRIAIEKLLYTGENKKFENKPASYIIPDPLTIKPTAWALSTMAGAKGYSGKDEESEVQHLMQQSESVRSSYIGEAKASVSQQIYNNKIKSGRFTTEAHEERLLESGLITYVQQMQDKQIAMGWTREEMSVFIANPQIMINANGWSAGSPFETSFAFKEVVWRATSMNQELFDSKTPEGFVAMRKGGMDKAARKSFKERMAEEGSDRFANLMFCFTDDPDKDIKYIKTKDKPTDMQFEKLFILYIKLIMAGYGMDYTELNLEDGKSGGLAGAGAALERMNVHKQTGFISIVNHVADCYTDALILPWCEDLETKFKVEFIFDTEQTKEQIEILNAKNSFNTLQEIRQEENLDLDWNIPKDVLTKNQEYFDSVKRFYHTPGITEKNIAQLIMKDMELKQQKEMAEQAQQEEQEQGEGEEPEGDEDIAGLQDLMKEEEPAEDMNKSFAFNVVYDYK